MYTLIRGMKGEVQMRTHVALQSLPADAARRLLRGLEPVLRELRERAAGSETVVPPVPGHDSPEGGGGLSTLSNASLGGEHAGPSDPEDPPHCPDLGPEDPARRPRRALRAEGSPRPRTDPVRL